MSERRIDRARWADLVASLVRQHARGNKSAFGRQIGVSTRTIDRWLNSQVDVSENSVREVARILGRMPADFLVQIGYYQDGELSSLAPLVEEDDPALQEIEAAAVPEAIRRIMRQRLIDQRAEMRAAEMREIAYWIEQYKQYKVVEDAPDEDGPATKRDEDGPATRRVG